MPNATRVALLAAAAVIHIGCSDATNPKPSPPAQITALPRELTEDEVRVSNAANQFSFTLFQRLNAAQPDENVFVSPLSISFALGMAMNGANSATLDQMRTTLGFGATELAEINQGYRGLLELEGTLDPSTTFTIANSVWYRQGFPVHASFLDEVREAFDASVNASPFDATTVTAVNQWVSDKTNGKIPTVLQTIDDGLVMFLINAIYFKGSWRDQFDPKKTMPLPFTGKSGMQTVPTMMRAALSGKMRAAYLPDVTVGELSYGNSAFVMSIVVPNEPGAIDAFTASLDADRWNTLIGAMQERQDMVALPKFTLSYERQLKDDLEAMGMVDPFDPGNADFSRMTSAQLYLSFVKHKTFVDVNEEGTEAAAVTVVGGSTTSMPPCLCVNRPFVFAIRERFSGTILFMGKMIRIP
ncbi:MAG TPA: serpin family protein [Gemmatimonadaceae bacterium]|nr:serpin family protein [Gemmatimonadaceae bacterium]